VSVKADFYPQELAKLLGYKSCFVVAVAVVVVVVVVVVACLLVLYSMKQFDNLPLQQVNNRSVHAIWYSATASGSLVS
jgi:hypothetical protein